MVTKSETVSSFLGGWVVTSVPASGRYYPEGDLAHAQTLAERCVALAEGQDITRGDLEAEVGPLAEHIRKALNIAQEAKDAPERPHPSRSAN